MTLPARTSLARVKLRWADHYLEVIDAEVSRWSDNDPIRLSRHHNADYTEYVLRLHFDPAPDMERWSLLVGDAIHNMRCALDHSVYRIALHLSNTDPPEDHKVLAFPICTSPEKFATAANRRLKTLPGAVRAVIEQAQPYNNVRENAAALWWLAQLDDIDKHRLSIITPLASVIDHANITNVEPGTWSVFHNTGSLKDDAPLLRIVLTKPNPNVTMQVRMTGAVCILGRWNAPPLGLLPTLEFIREEVGVVCRRLEMFL